MFKVTTIAATATTAAATATGIKTKMNKERRKERKKETNKQTNKQQPVHICQVLYLRNDVYVYEWMCVCMCVWQRVRETGSEGVSE